MDADYKVGCTGHRKLFTREPSIKNKVKENLELILLRNAILEVNTGMALGFDQVVCDACLELGIPFVAVVPCEDHDRLWNPVQKQRYSMLIAKAKRIELVSPGSYEPWKMHARNGWIVNHSKEMIVYWDGIFAGGTGGCMKLINSKKLPYTNLFIRT